jgi:hypothetical protein
LTPSPYSRKQHKHSNSRFSRIHASRCLNITTIVTLISLYLSLYSYFMLLCYHLSHIKPSDDKSCFTLSIVFKCDHPLHPLRNQHNTNMLQCFRFFFVCCNTCLLLLYAFDLYFLFHELMGIKRLYFVFDELYFIFDELMEK